MLLCWMLLGAFADEPTFAQLATGEDFTCGRTDAGSVLCWGNNEDQQLGVSKSTTQRSTTPVDVGIGGAVDISASAVQACAVFQSGEVRCWGQTQAASWGSGVLPTRRAMAGAQTSVGPARGCSRLRDGNASCWEPIGTEPLDLTALSGVAEVGVGAAHACARTTGGDVWCWGDDRKGQLGNSRPGWPSTAAPVEGVVDVVDLSVGEHNTCVVTRPGKVICWGPNGDGNLGLGHTDAAWGPQQVKGVDEAVEVSVGRREACARTGRGKVLCWGADPCPRPDAPTRRLEPVDLGIRDATALSGGSIADHRCALVKGRPVCWGFNSHGQAGDPSKMCIVRP